MKVYAESPSWVLFSFQSLSCLEWTAPLQLKGCSPDLVSQAGARAATLEDALDAMSGLYLERKDPVVKSKRVLKVQETAQPIQIKNTSKLYPQLGLGRVLKPRQVGEFAKRPRSKRLYRPATLDHQIQLRDLGQCVEKDEQGNPKYAEIYLDRVGFRLPTEAEWEVVSRAGTESAYTFGSDQRLLESYGWFQQNSNEWSHPTAESMPNLNGLYDVHGNLLEWCHD